MSRAARARASRRAGSGSAVDRAARMAPWSRMWRTSARVSTPVMPGTSCSRSQPSRSPRGAPVADHRAQVAHHQRGGPDAVALVVLGVDAGVADVGGRQGDQLAVVGGIGEDLLVPGQAGVEHDLAGRVAAGAERRVRARGCRPRGRGGPRERFGHRCSIRAGGGTYRPKGDLYRTRSELRQGKVGGLRRWVDRGTLSES